MNSVFSEQMACKWLLLYCIYLHHFLPTSQCPWVTLDPQEFRATEWSQHRSWVWEEQLPLCGGWFQIWGFLCTNRLRVCIGSPDQFWLLAQGTLLPKLGSHPGITSCSYLWHHPPAELT